MPEAAMPTTFTSLQGTEEHEQSRALLKGLPTKRSWASMSLAKMSFGLGLTG